MSKLQRVCAIGDVAPAGVLGAEIVGADGAALRLAIARDSDGTWHALDEMCTHGDVPLSECDVEDDAIDCWGHGARFDLNTGQPTLPATKPVNIYPVTIDGDDVLVDPVPVNL